MDELVKTKVCIIFWWKRKYWASFVVLKAARFLKYKSSWCIVKSCKSLWRFLSSFPLKPCSHQHHYQQRYKNKLRWSQWHYLPKGPGVNKWHESEKRKWEWNKQFYTCSFCKARGKICFCVIKKKGSVKERFALHTHLTEIEHIGFCFFSHLPLTLHTCLHWATNVRRLHWS